MAHFLCAVSGTPFFDGNDRRTVMKISETIAVFMKTIAHLLLLIFDHFWNNSTYAIKIGKTI